VEWGKRGAGQVADPQAQGGAAFHFLRAADHAFGRAAQQDCGAKPLAYCGDDEFSRVGVVGGKKHERQVHEPGWRMAKELTRN